MIDKEELIQMISDAFSDTHYPGDENIVYDNSGNDPESVEIAQDFRGLKWQDVPNATLAWNKGSFGFFTVEALRYYFPAYLLISVTDYIEADVIPLNIFGKVTPPEDSEEKSEAFHHFINGFSREQKQAIKMFLMYMHENYEADYLIDSPPQTENECEEENREEELEELNEAIQLEPDQVLHYHARAEIFEEMGKFEEAIKDYSTAIALVEPPELDETQYLSNLFDYRGWVHAKAGNLQEAIEDLSQAIALQPPYIHMSYFSRGKFFYDNGFYARGIEDFSTFIDSPKKVSLGLLGTAYGYRGLCHQALGQHDEAIEDLTHAVDTKRRNPWPDVHYSRGLAYMNKGDREEALEDFARTLEIDPDYSHADQINNYIAELKTGAEPTA